MTADEYAIAYRALLVEASNSPDNDLLWDANRDRSMDLLDRARSEGIARTDIWRISDRMAGRPWPDEVLAALDFKTPDIDG